MFIFGHTGITLAAAALINGLITGSGYEEKGKIAKVSLSESQDIRPERKILTSFADWFESLERFMDIRILLLGSLLPDIIDKPLGFFIFGNGRTVAHTLLLTIIVLALGFYLYFSRRRMWLLTLSLGMLSHLILDGMWFLPNTFFWPFLGWAFPSRETFNWIASWFSALSGNSMIYIPEIIGLLVISVFIWTLVRRRKLVRFLAKGILYS
jgi:inner membrane protein